MTKNTAKRPQPPPMDDSDDEINHSSDSSGSESSELLDQDSRSENDSDDLETQEAELEDALGDVPLEQLVAIRQQMQPTKMKASIAKTKQQRKDKNAPAEMSTKRAVSRFRQVLPGDKPVRSANARAAC